MIYVGLLAGDPKIDDHGLSAPAGTERGGRETTLWHPPGKNMRVSPCPGHTTKKEEAGSKRGQDPQSWWKEAPEDLNRSVFAGQGVSNFQPERGQSSGEGGGGQGAHGTGRRAQPRG